MPAQTRTRVTYSTTLCDGIRDKTDDSGKDEPFIIQVNKVTHNDVTDGRGRNWRASSKHSEEIARLTVRQAGDLISALADDIAFAAEVAEGRVLDA